MLASNWAFASAKNNFTSVSRLLPSRLDTHCANRHQCPGGCSERGPSDQYSAIAFVRSFRPTLNAMSWSTSTRCSALANGGGGGARNTDPDGSANGLTCPQCATASRCTVPFGSRNGCQRDGSTSTSGLLTG